MRSERGSGNWLRRIPELEPTWRDRHTFIRVHWTCEVSIVAVSRELVRQESRARERSEIERRRVFVARRRFLEANDTAAEIVTALQQVDPPIIASIRTVDRDITTVRESGRRYLTARNFDARFEVASALAQHELITNRDTTRTRGQRRRSEVGTDRDSRNGSKDAVTSGHQPDRPYDRPVDCGRRIARGSDQRSRIATIARRRCCDGRRTHKRSGTRVPLWRRSAIVSGGAGRGFHENKALGFSTRFVGRLVQSLDVLFEATC